MAWLTLLFFLLAVVMMFVDEDTLKAVMISPLWFLTLWGVWRFKLPAASTLR